MELIVDIKKVLSDFSLNISFHSNSTSLALLGESGSGKSVTLKCISGLLTPDEGKIIVNRRVFFDSSKKINMPVQQRKIGFLFQNYALFSNMTVYKNISYALNHLHQKAKKNTLENIIKNMRLEDITEKYPAQLSGGQQQRVALARALAVSPQALLLDEPFSALDNTLKSIMIKQMLDTLLNYNGIAILVTHNVDEAYQLCEDIVVLEKGQSKGQGNKKEIFMNPPSLAALKLTGCKNICLVKKTDDYTVKAIDWNCTIKLEQPIYHDVTHIGLRAHYIKIADSSSINAYDCWPASCSETRFRRFVFLKLNFPPIDISDYDILWDISVEEWKNIKKQPYPWKITFDTDNLILINESL
ncbi:sulfate/molybdate ABC transporter ATP-binding protein [Clostridium oryzae]|uniref:Sulfate/thiosulfate import ATP-binding protein CysA n=1 Tax=Clostridium oryzae TaxID=1450648 RepID=A0A1V4IPV8_9CLOT|nr:sulfate/molybdate ABC transporter ATP-binding protein [Clostridium oryzae]OPJ61919.1 sulfate/thiosulfate import ATP-binding protein CysA [Clostridium oryzae]